MVSHNNTLRAERVPTPTFPRLEEAAHRLGIVHYHTYPHSPKMNAHIERFNRTLSEEFLAYHRPLMRDDIATFNKELIDYMLWYNTKRPHASLNYTPPLRYYVSTLHAGDCHMLWTSTES